MGEPGNTASYYRYWGKAGLSDSSHHLLPYHCLDAAAVGEALLSQHEPTKHLHPGIWYSLLVGRMGIRFFEIHINDILGNP